MKSSKKSDLESILQDLRGEYLKNFPTRLANLQDQLKLHNWEGLQSEFHKLKGNGQTLGFKWVTEISDKIERDLKNCPHSDHEQLGQHILKALKLLHIGLQDPYHFNLEGESIWSDIKQYEPNS